MCSTLRVSRSGYYAWRHRPQSNRSKVNQDLRSRIRVIHEGSGKTYGARRIVAELHDEGYRCSTKRVARLMQLEGLRAHWKKRFRVTTGSTHRLPTSPNVLAQCFDAKRSDERWVGDITYIPTLEGWLYLAVLIDLHSRRVVGWATSSSLSKQLAIDALQMALGQREAPAGLVHHTDRSVRLERVSAHAGPARLRGKHEPQGQLL
jgi:transposase InsO family protein